MPEKIRILSQPDLGDRYICGSLALDGAVMEITCPDCGEVTSIDGGLDDQVIEDVRGRAEHVFGIYCHACDAEVEATVRYSVVVRLEEVEE